MSSLEAGTPEERVYRLLTDQRIQFETLVHGQNETEQEVMQRCGLTLHQGAKSMILRGDNSFLLVVLAGDYRLDLKKTKTAFEINKVRLATNEEIQGLMGCSIGSCYPIGFLIGLNTYVDKSITDNETIFFNPGAANKWVKMRWSAYEALVKPDLVSVSQDKTK